MPQNLACILLDEGLAPYAKPLEQHLLAGPGGLLGNCAFVPPAAAPRWAGPFSGRLVQPGQGSPVFICGSCTSTFDVAWELVRHGCLPPWGAVIAGRQNHGRGQLRRPWHSPEGNLYVSFLLPQSGLFAHAAASLFVGFLVQQALCALGVPAKLKWPNDILLQNNNFGAKAGGLLLEEREGLVVAGLGLNLRHCPPKELLREGHAVPAASLALWNFSPYPLWAALLGNMRNTYDTLQQISVYEALRQVEAALAWKNLTVRAHDEEGELQGYITGLGEQGELLLRDHRGEVHAIHSGSVSPVGMRPCGEGDA